MSRFPQTRWSLVLAAASADAPERTRALAELCEIYWPPLYAFARLRGFDRSVAEESIQGFFADFLARDGFPRADASRGRLRGYLLSALTHYLAHERDRSAAAKRGQAITSAATMDEIDRLVADGGPPDPESGFMRVWATRVLERALVQLRSEYDARGKAELFDALAEFLVEGASAQARAEAGARLGLTPGGMKVALHRLRQRFGQRLRAEVAHTVADPGDIDAELQALLAAMAAL